MKVLFIIVLLMHLMTLVNVTIYDGDWDGIVLFSSTVLFLIGAIYYGASYRSHNKGE